MGFMADSMAFKAHTGPISEKTNQIAALELTALSWSILLVKSDFTPQTRTGFNTHIYSSKVILT